MLRVYAHRVTDYSCGWHRAVSYTTKVREYIYRRVCDMSNNYIVFTRRSINREQSFILLPRWSSAVLQIKQQTETKRAMGEAHGEYAKWRYDNAGGSLSRNPEELGCVYYDI